MTGPDRDGRGSPTLWDELSRHYDRQRWLERSAVEAAVDLLAPTGRERCADLGTGTGEVLRCLARRSHPPARVIGVDSSPGMLARVSALPAGWSLRLGDVRSLPLPDACCDAVTASYLLHLLDERDLPVALAEISRVLSADGRLVTVTPAIPADGLARPLGAALDRLAHRGPVRFGGLRALDPTAALTRAGFTVIGVRWSIRGYPSVCVLATPDPGAKQISPAGHGP
jgi:ubiquinone/menaquinone biosynthesis C-methylase UbiE